jgi:hypothetical protein
MAKGAINQHKNLAMTGKVKTPAGKLEKTMKAGGMVKKPKAGKSC